MSKLWRVIGDNATEQVLLETSAENVTVADTGEKLEATTVEGALNELADSVNELRRANTVITGAKITGELSTTGWTMTSEWAESNLPSARKWTDIAYGNGVFVAMPGNGYWGAYSTDGINWTEVNYEILRDRVCVTYGGDKFVALSRSSQYGEYSTDGINWSVMTMPKSRVWVDITCGNGKFVAISDTRYGAYSTDGINWTTMTMPNISLNNPYECVTYGGDKFVSVAHNTQYGAYSTDGINWTQMSLGAIRNWIGITYGNGKFVAIARKSEYGAYSTDGINWTEMTMPSKKLWHDIAYGNGMFVATAEDTNIVAYSTDGINWFTNTLMSTDIWYGVTYGRGKFITVAFDSARTAYWDVSKLSYNYTISDTAIKANSTVSMYLNSADEVRAYSKTDGSVVVEMDAVPTVAIPYTLQVIGTSTEGAFEIVNSYVPTKTSELTNDSGFLTKDNFVAGDNVTITNENDNLIISATGGGGGGAASYKAIKSTLTPSDWQEVAKQPYFVGSNAMEWPIDDVFGGHAKRSNDIIGLTSGVDYTMSVTVDGQVYTKTAQILDTSQTGGVKVLSLDLTDDDTLVVQINDDVSAVMPDVSSFVIIQAPTTVTSFVITSFTGVGLASSGKAIISDSAIKVNSSVTMYTNTSEKISVGEKTNGSVTLTAPSIPTTEIPYSLEIVGTDTEGLFELVNGYVPEIPSVSSDYNDFSNIPIINQDLSSNGFTPVKDTYYRHTGTTDSNHTKGVIYKCVETDSTSKPLRLFELSTIYDVQMTIDQAVVSLLPAEKNITEASANVSITGSASPYLFTVTDSDIGSYDFIRLYPMDEDTETWLNEHTVSSIITEESGKFTFKVDTNTLPTAYSMKYVIESFM